MEIELEIGVPKPGMVKVQKKGQVTIPVDIRRFLGLDEGDLVEFSVNEEGEVLMRNVVVTEARIAVKAIREYLKENKISVDDLNKIAQEVQEELSEKLRSES